MADVEKGNLLISEMVRCNGVVSCSLYSVKAQNNTVKHFVSPFVVLVKQEVLKDGLG